MSDDVMEKGIKVVIAVCVILGLVVGGFFLFMLFRPVLLSGPRDRLFKNFSADINGGLNRVVTVYSYSGAPIRSWSGKIDLSSSTKEVNMIIDNDKRVIIQGGVVIVEEQ